MSSLSVRALTILLTLLFLACRGTAADMPDAEPTARDQGLALVPVTTALAAPWGMDFLGDRELLITEQGGRLLRLDLSSGELREIAGVPETEVFGQGGLLDVLVEPTGAGPMVYLSYAHITDDGATTRIAKANLVGDRLENLQVLFTAEPYYRTKRHFGSRLLIVDDYLFFTVGDRGNRQYAQDLSRHNGKVMRLNKDGSVPGDNPFVGRDDARPEIWTYGHRNPQGLAQHPDGSIWVSEHGPQGGDELNRLEPGNNYGWPVITYGEEYGGGKIGEGTRKPGMEQPEHYYVPSIATCGIDFYTADTYPGWSDSVLVSALALTHLNRVALDGDGVGSEYRYFEDAKMRFRDVQTGPDGYVYVLAGGGLYRVVPVGS